MFSGRSRWRPRHRRQTEQKRILVLYSTRRDSQFSLVGERELPRILDDGLSRNLDYYAEFVDLARSPEPGYRTAFRDFLRQKYQGVRFDLVIAMQDSAVGFVNDHGDALFPDTPVVFLTNSPARKHRPNSTGLILERNFAATVTFIRQLQPDVQQVFIITGAAATDQDVRECGAATAAAAVRRWTDVQLFVRPGDRGPRGASIPHAGTLRCLLRDRQQRPRWCQATSAELHRPHCGSGKRSNL